PNQVTLRIGQFLGCAQVIQMIVVNPGLFGAVPIHQRQVLKAIWLVDVSTVLVASFLSDQAVTLPEEFGSSQTIGFGNTAAEGVILVVPGASVRFDDAAQAVFAVVAVAGDQFLAL